MNRNADVAYFCQDFRLKSSCVSLLKSILYPNIRCCAGEFV
jgi:hypothetical protein